MVHIYIVIQPHDVSYNNNRDNTTKNQTDRKLRHISKFDAIYVKYEDCHVAVNKLGNIVKSDKWNEIKRLGCKFLDVKRGAW